MINYYSLFQYDRYSLNALIIERIIKGYGKKTLLNELNFNYMSNDITYAEYSNIIKKNIISDKILKNSNIYQCQSIFHFRDFICKFYFILLFHFNYFIITSLIYYLLLFIMRNILIINILSNISLGFMLARENKDAPEAVEYWFRCVDLDDDGYISIYELEKFYVEQCKHMVLLNISDYWTFPDYLCYL